MTEVWWRSWHGAPMDSKWLAVAARAGVKVGVVSAIAWALLDFASQHSERGSVTGFDPEVYAAYSGFPESEVTAVIQAMTDKGVLVNNKFANWDKRQPKSEVEIERSRINRSKQALRPATECYDSLQIATPGYLRGEGEEEGDTDIDSEKEKRRADATFDHFQRALETRGIVLTGASDIQAIQEMISMGATISDLLEGFAWRAANSSGKPVRYAASLVGPTRTAMQKRLQDANGGRRVQSEDQTLEAQRQWLARLNP